MMLLYVTTRNVAYQGIISSNLCVHFGVYYVIQILGPYLFNDFAIVNTVLNFCYRLGSTEEVRLLTFFGFDFLR